MIDIAALDLTALPSIALPDYKTLPATSAIYFVLAADGAVLYIGRTISLAQRWPQHHRMRQFTADPDRRIAWMGVNDPEVLPRIEKALIDYFSPLYNATRNDAELRQTTLRIEPDVLHKARYYLNQEGLNVTEFLVQQLVRYIEEKEQNPSAPQPSPERLPRA